jgi:hypothetical protein
VLGLFCALAEQCFLNEYVFAQTAEETGRAEPLCALLQQRLGDGANIPVALIAAVGAYYPLHAVPKAESLLRLKWPDYAAGLLRQQVKEPLEEIEDRAAIPARRSTTAPRSRSCGNTRKIPIRAGQSIR